ncbi:serine/threonine protein kinase [Streptomyces sp. TLI_55]|uniref:serine/threonine-protein kinase n=1 Tax=Streptomyces sp. TLI_55 TaxID=1938861 RepID=UPI000BC83720|nr:serine/threonine-protein kinase [Streptomyces sp. TLI_55]SNX62484.1 serine/threonine protein kinase [Streptomyces sp. TLI_55]
MGEVFAGRYELVDPIGRGGVGAVWRAWDHRRRRYVAAKVLQQRDAHSLLRFVREQALRIDHPHVLAPASWAADDDKVLFTMDLVGGGSLVHLVGDYGPLPPFFVCTLLDQLLSGLAAVHAEDVVHRDIKPANLLLEATGAGRPRLRLSDFGIAMRLGEARLTETDLVVGTPGYIAPEQMMGSEPDFPADLFAVGLVALYLLEGARPDTKALVQYFAAHGTPGAPKGIPEPLWQVVATLLQPDPQARFRTATGARKALASAMELLPEPGPDDELIEIFDQLGPLPPGFGPEGPLKPAPGVETTRGARAAREARGAPADPTDSSWPDTDRSSDSVWPGTGSVTTDPRRGAASSRTADPHSAAASSRTTDPRHAAASTGTTDPRHAAAPGVVPPAPGVVPPGPRQGTATGPTPDNTPPRPQHPPTTDPSTGAQPPSMSDTGSFHLPPPQTTAPEPQHSGTPQQPTHPASIAPHDPTHVLPTPRPEAPHQPNRHDQPGRPHQPHQSPHPAPPLTPPLPRQPADASTASYTAQVPQVPPPAQPIPRRRGSRARRRPGPPAKVTLPLLLLALTCYAVGFWALTRI